MERLRPVLPSILALALAFTAGPAPSTGSWLVAYPASGPAAGPLTREPLPDEPDAALGRFEGDLAPLERDLLRAAARGELDSHGFLRAALVASGVLDETELRRYEAQFEQWVTILQRSEAVRGTPVEQAAAIFDFMHQQILQGGYALECTELTWIHNQGRFNCVSGTVLFHALASRMGLSTCGLELPGHAMCRLSWPGGSMDVETTCPRWFRLMDQPSERARLIEKTLGFEPPSEAARRECREVSAPQLVAMIYYNRGVDLLAAKRFSEALAANAKALRLDPPSATARGNLLATLNNWAIDLGMAHRYAEAVALLNQGLDLDPAYETFRINYLHVHHQWIDSLCRAGRFPEAFVVQQQALVRLPRDVYLLQAGDAILARQKEATSAVGR